MALASATQWLFNFVVARAVPNMIATVGYKGYGTYFIFGSFGVVMFFFVWFLIPETKGTHISRRYLPTFDHVSNIRAGVSLEQMDALFGVDIEEKQALAAEAEKSAATNIEVTGHRHG